MKGRHRHIYSRVETSVFVKVSSYGGPQLSRQNLFRHGKIILATTKSFSSRQNHFGHGKIIFVTAKSFWPRQNHFGHGKIIFVTAKSFSTTAKSFLYSRDLCPQGVMGVNQLWPTTNSQFH